MSGDIEMLGQPETTSDKITRYLFEWSIAASVIGSIIILLVVAVCYAV